LKVLADPAVADKAGMGFLKPIQAFFMSGVSGSSRSWWRRFSSRPSVVGFLGVIYPNDSA